MHLDLRATALFLLILLLATRSTAREIREGDRVRLELDHAKGTTSGVVWSIDERSIEILDDETGEGHRVARSAIVGAQAEEVGDHHAAQGMLIGLLAGLALPYVVESTENDPKKGFEVAPLALMLTAPVGMLLGGVIGLTYRDRSWVEADPPGVWTGTEFTETHSATPRGIALRFTRSF